MAESYEEMVRDVEELEKGAAPPEVSFVDISALEGAEPEQRTSPDFGSMVDAAESAESRRPIREAPQPVQRAKQVQQQVQQPAPSVQKDKERAKEELTAVASKLPNANAPAPSVKIKYKKSAPILPSLSIADQISELEKISEGLREHVFDKEQLKIVREELDGLSKAARREQKEATISLRQLDSSLAIIRAQRLNDAITLLEQYR